MPTGQETRVNAVGAMLRGAAIVVRFGLVAFLARYYPLAALGVFGLFQASHVIGVQLIGFELYTFGQREIVTSDVQARAEILWSQIRFYLVGYLLAVPLVIGLGAANVLPWTVLGLLFVAMVSGHVVTETSRLLVATSHPQASYVVQFCANAAWVPVVVCLGLVHPAWRDVHLVFAGWALMSTATAIASWWYLRRRRILVGTFGDGNWATITRAIRVARNFIIMALCARGIEYADRFFLDSYRGQASVGTYTFYARVASATYDLVFAGVVSILFPRLIASARADSDASASARTALLRRILVALAVLVPCVAVGTHVLVAFLGRAELAANMPAFYMLLGSYAALTLGLYPHMVLYSQGRDSTLAWTAMVSTGVDIGLNALMVPSYGLEGAATASLGAACVWTLLRWGAAHVGARV